MTHRDVGVAVAREDHLALFGELESSVDRVRRLRQDGRVGRSAAATERAAASVEEGEVDAGILRPRRNLRLRFVQRQVRGDRADVLRRVGVAEHDLEVAVGCVQTRGEVGVADDLGHDRGRGLQIGEGFEQRDHVEHRGSAARADRVAGEAVHVREVGRRLRERHDVAARGARPVAALDLRDRAEDLEHLLSLRAERARELAARGRGIALGEDLRMDGGVLAHLELGQVESERLDLPQQLLQVPVRLSRSARGDERVLHDAQVVQQVRRVAVRQVGVATARRGDAAPEQQHHALVRLDLGPLRGIRSPFFVGGAEALQQRRQGRAGRRRPR